MKERLQGLIKTLHTGSSDPAYSKTFRRRTLGLTFLIIVLVVILIIRLTVVQLIQGPATAQQAAAFRTVDSTVQAIRGNITDTNGASWPRASSAILSMQIKRVPETSSPSPVKELMNLPAMQ